MLDRIAAAIKLPIGGLQVVAVAISGDQCDETPGWSANRKLFSSFLFARYSPATDTTNMGNR